MNWYVDARQSLVDKTKHTRNYLIGFRTRNKTLLKSMAFIR